MPIRALIFDLDETLLYEEESVEKAFHSTCKLAEEQYRISPQALTESVRQRARELWDTFPTYELCMDIGISSWEGLAANFAGDVEPLPTLRELAPGFRHASWTRALLDHGVRDEELVTELTELFESERPRYHVPFPECKEVLNALNEKYALAILTNGPPHHQREKLRCAGVEDYFEVVVVSGDIGIGKPNAPVFAHTLNLLDVDASEVMMIGDSLERDIKGAMNVGISSTWVNRNDAESGPEARPDHEISNLKELISMLK